MNKQVDIDPLSLMEVLKKLIKASNILLNEKNYDDEEIRIATNRAEEMVQLLGQWGNPEPESLNLD